MLVLPEKKLCFLANPKTASFATELALHSLGFQTYGDRHCTPAQSGYEIDDTWTVFCTIRNHFDVMVSWYFHCTRTPNSWLFGYSFERFLYTWAHNSEWFSENQMYHVRLPLCDKVLRYETLQADFDAFLIQNGLPAVPLEKHNVSARRRGRDYRQFYSDKAADFMRNKFSAEMCALDYRF